MEETIEDGAPTEHQTKENHYDAMNQLYKTIDAKGSTAESAGDVEELLDTLNGEAVADDLESD